MRATIPRPGTMREGHKPVSGLITAAVVTRARRRIVEHFVRADAVAADRATGFVPGGRVERRTFERMRAFGAIRDAAPERYWLDHARLTDFRKESLARVLGILAIAGLAAAGAIAVGG